jgi:hypothetical protein
VASPERAHGAPDGTESSVEGVDDQEEHDGDRTLRPEDITLDADDLKSPRQAEDLSGTLPNGEITEGEHASGGPDIQVNGDQEDERSGNEQAEVDSYADQSGAYNIRIADHLDLPAPFASSKPMGHSHSSHAPPPTKEAIRSLINLEIKFAALRDSLYEERLEEAAIEEEMVLNGMCLGWWS